MALYFGLTKYLLLFALVEQAFLVPAPVAPRSPSTKLRQQEQRPPKLVEIKLPVKITSMEDLVAWAKNAMRSMASRIDITLAAVDEPVGANREKFKPKPKSDSRHRQREPVSLSFEPRRTDTSSALLSTFASLLNPESSFETVIDDQQNDLNRDVLPYGNVNAYLPVLLDEFEISKYREEALKKYYVESEKATKREKNRKEREKDKKPTRYSQAIAQQTSNVRSDNNDVKLPLAKSKNKDNEKLTPVISVPFEAVVTITRENVVDPARHTYEETRDPPDEFPPYFDKEYPRREIPGDPEFSTKPKGNSEKRQLTSLGDLLRMLGLTKRLTTRKKDGDIVKGTSAESSNSRPRKPAEKFTPPPIIQFEDEPLPPRRNETSQRQEFDDDSEEQEGSLGSFADVLPLVIPILEDLSDPESDVDLGEVLQAALPLFEGFLNNEDPNAPNILAMLGPIVATIIGGKDGMGSDAGALIGPLLQLVGPLIGPLSGPLSTAISGGGGGGSSVASLITAFIAPLIQPGPDGNTPITAIVSSIVARLSKDLRLGQPGGLDIGALVGGVLSGVLSGTSAGLSGTLSGGKGAPPKPYGPYGPDPAGSVNTGTSAGFVVPGPQINSFHQRYPNQRPIPGPVNIVEHHGFIQRTTQRPYTNVPQRIHPGPPPPLQNFVQHQGASPIQTGASSTNSGGSSYLPYGNNAVPAGSVNPLGLVGSSIKDILGGGINLVSSLINAVFGVSGASSADKPAPAYGPPAQGYH